MLKNQVHVAIARFDLSQQGHPILFLRFGFIPFFMGSSSESGHRSQYVCMITLELLN